MYKMKIKIFTPSPNPQKTDLTCSFIYICHIPILLFLYQFQVALTVLKDKGISYLFFLPCYLLIF